MLDQPRRPAGRDGAAAREPRGRAARLGGPAADARGNRFHRAAAAAATCRDEALDQLYAQDPGLGRRAGAAARAGEGVGRRSPTRRTSSTSQLVFDYLAGEIFQKTDAGTQDLLLNTAYLAQMTAAMAQALTGNERAGRILAELHRNNYFVALRQARPEPVYQYHPMFREFLLARIAGGLHQGRGAAHCRRRPPRPWKRGPDRGRDRRCTATATTGTRWRGSSARTPRRCSRRVAAKPWRAGRRICRPRCATSGRGSCTGPRRARPSSRRARRGCCTRRPSSCSARRRRPT